MKPSTWIVLAMAVTLTLAVTACSDDDQPLTDGGPTGDGSPRCGKAGEWSCSEPGKACNAHDPCAINPICGKDYCCRAELSQDCSDELDCTSDTCAGSGLCSHTVKPGYCALMVTGKQQCIKANFINPANPCLLCDPTKDQKKWSSGSGSTCDDGASCTKNDVCTAGICKGTYYGNKCGDGLECTDDLCDGKGACANKMKSNYCLINKTCYKDGANDSIGCAFCDVSVDQYAWTPRKDICKIGAFCHAKGVSDTTGCGVCDPSKTSTAWSAAPDHCLIQGSCFKKDELAPSGCGTCDPAKSKSAFSPVPGKCLINGKCYADKAASSTGCGVCAAATDSSWWSLASGAKQTSHDFEKGMGTWKATALVSGLGWQVDKGRAHGGSSSLYYGDPKTGTYDNGKVNKGTVTSGVMGLPAGQKASFSFWVYQDIESGATHDVLTAVVAGKVVWSKAAAYRRWYPVEIDLSAYAGQAVTLSFVFDTKDSWANSGEGVYIDDAALRYNCGKK